MILLVFVQNWRFLKIVVQKFPNLKEFRAAVPKSMPGILRSFSLNRQAENLENHSPKSSFWIFFNTKFCSVRPCKIARKTALKFLGLKYRRMQN
jgi:hypothetical protein